MIRSASPKYARPHYLPHDTNNGINSSFEVVKKYITQIKTDTGGEINNLKHLRGAATLLLVQKPDNYTFMLLKAFSNFAIDSNSDEFIKDAQENLFNGFVQLYEYHKDDMPSIYDKVVYFKEAVSMFNAKMVPRIQEIEDILFHKIHGLWLNQYNKKIGGRYAGTNQ